jgi:hypothetical protein
VSAGKELKYANTQKIEFLKGTSLVCRAGTMDMSKGESIRSYIQNAFRDELDAAEKLKDDGEIINIEISELDVNSTRGIWSLDFVYKVSDLSIRIKTKYEFETAFVASVACTNAKDTFPDAVGQNIQSFFERLKKEQGY